MSARDAVFGAIMCIVAILLGIIYLFALFGPGGYALWAIEIVVSVGFLIVLAIMFWIGWTILKTPSIEELEKVSKAK